MNRPVKLTLMFGPLVLMFAVIALVTTDIRHPEITRLECRVLGTGQAASGARRADNVLYANSASPQSDIALECGPTGVVVVNDTDLFQTEIARGNPAVVTQKQYRYLPDRWQIEVRTVREPAGQ